MGAQSGSLRRNLLQATFLSTSLVAGAVPYARAQTCTPAQCTISPGVASISGDAPSGNGDTGVSVTIDSSGTQNDIALSGTARGGTGANGTDGEWHLVESNVPATAGQDGGNGGSVTITNSGVVVPTSGNLTGLYAAAGGAVAGAGGNGTVDVDGANGGNGGNGGTIVITNGAGGAITIGDSAVPGHYGAAGILALSSGGAGGLGGGNGSSSYAGASGNGGSGGTISITNAAAITTSGNNTSGIVAVGTGGAGGNGVSYNNSAFITNNTVGNGGDGAGAASIGSNGIAQGSAITAAQAAVAVANTGSITVSSAGADAPHNIFSGIWANASGGNGGNVGYSVTAGGNGGNGGTAYVSHSGTIQVDGRDSSPSSAGYAAAGAGALARGGGGGQGGVHYYNYYTYGGVGGNGGSGGIASIVITSGSSIVTTASQVPAILADASGGTGGLAGFGDGISSAGGNGGAGGTATVSASGMFQTAGANAPALAALATGGQAGLPAFSPYSVAGGTGGKGGTVIVDATFTAPPAGQYTTTGANSPALIANASGGDGATGKNGGAGGKGGAATVTVSGQILVSGSSSNGISVLANGGAGGKGGVDQYGNQGTGGAGGTGGTATVTSSASVFASGAGATGVYVSTQGGSTGVGSIYAWPINAGAGGDATVTSSGAIVVTGSTSGAGLQVNTSGGSAYAISYYLAPNHVIVPTITSQTTGSGGAGGNATVTVSASVTTGGNPTPPVWNPGEMMAPAVLIQTSGGNGGYGGQYGHGKLGNGGGAGTISLDVVAGAAGAPQFFTAGVNSPAIALQAIGGVGGIGRGERGGSADDAGSGGNGGAGGAITLHIYAAGVGIVTTGAQSAGIYALSRGGDGGSGWNGGDGDYAAGGGGAGAAAGYSISITNGGVISTGGNSSSGIEVLSLGGNGGDLGSNGAGGQSGNVEVLNSGAIVTTGDSSHGIMNMSVGGGGGAYANYDSQLKKLSIKIQGGQGASGANAGVSTLVNSGSITTHGAASYGIFAASMGGGGGAGGSVANLGLGAFGVPSVEIAIGGNGGSGGTGGTVNVTNNAGGDIVTTGWGSGGIGVLSLGGDGGVGGQASSSSFAFGFLPEVPSFTFAATIAGNGGTGGTGGTVNVSNVGDITTTGAMAPGMVAQSIGGGGGAGGNALAQSLAFGVSPNSTITVTAGGSGGSGGNGGQITVDNTNSADPGFTGTAVIFTTGFASDAIAAYSIGGGGGQGGVGVSAVDSLIPVQSVLGFLPLAFTASFSENITLGGNGGSGGDGGQVTVTNDYKLGTTGLDARGIVAMSIGGGGGTAAAGKATASQEITIDFTIGGDGGVGGNGGVVNVTNTSSGSIRTSADGAHGILAASIGGGGGTAGTATADTQSSQDDQTWEALTKATVEAIAHYAKLGSSVLEFSPTVQVTFNVGGTGGAGGNGENVTVVNDGIIATGIAGGTGGDLAIGIIAQSIGGGGGSGGAATASGARLLNSNMIVGGSGGANGTGGTVTVTSTGPIATSGDSAFGVLAQSIGGGGGIGGIATSVGTAQFLPNITIGNGSGPTLPAESTTSQTVNVSTNAVSTSGVEAHAIVAQSISGGGGLFFVNPSDETDLGNLSYQTAIENAVVAAVGQDAVDAAAAAFAAALAASSGVITLDIGGQSAGGGNGGAVNVTNSGTITTTGADAFGILAQSIGGGGGFFTDGEGLSLVTLAVTGSLGNTTAASTAEGGGPVTVTLADGSAITTTGAGATAIVAQSIGGGGGYTGAIDATGMSYQTFLGASDNQMSVNANSAGGDVLIQTQGAASITTTGANAHGIVAQSLSGGGGLVGDQNGIVIPQASGGSSRNLAFDASGFTPGTVTINYTGTLSTSGSGSMAIFVQDGVQTTSGAIDRSYASTPSGDVSVAIGANSVITGGTGTGVAIFIDGGGTNTVTIGSGAHVSAGSNVAISIPWGTTSLTNYGTIMGDVSLGTAGSDSTSTVSFFNAPGGYYQSIGTPPSATAPGAGLIQLGDGGSMSNAGTFNVGGTNIIATATINGPSSVAAAAGAFAQTASGVLEMDVQGAQPNLGRNSSSDHLVLTSAGYIGGTLALHVVNAISPTDQFTLISQTGGLTSMAIAAADLNYETAKNGGPQLTWTPTFTQNTLTIAPVADFTPAGMALDGNQAAYARHLQATWDAGGSAALAPAYADLVNLPSGAAYQKALGTALPSILGAAPVAAIGASRTALGSVLSCPEFLGTGTLLQQGDCTWARVDGGYTSFTPSNYTGFDLNQISYRLGAQKEVAPGWFAGAAVAYEVDSFSNEFGYSSSNGQSIGASASLKREEGPWLFSSAAHFSYGWYDTTRQTIVGASSFLSSSSYEAYAVAGRLRAEYALPFQNWYLKPYGQMDLIYTSVPGFTEGGHLSPYDLVVAQSDNFTVALGPHLEVGARIDLPDGSTLRPYGTIGATWFSDNTWEVTAALANAPTAAGTFSTDVSLPDLLADVNLGLQWSSTQGVDLRLGYEGVFGDDYASHAGSLRFSLRF